MALRRNPRPAPANAAPFPVEALESRTLFHGPGPLLITEFLADNTAGLRDETSAFSDWIEIHNPTAADVNADGFYLTDDASLPTKWRLPPAVVPANGFLVVFASDQDRTAPQLHANFKLDADGEYLALVRPDGLTVSDAYAPRYPEQLDDVSYGVLGTAERYFTTPTPGGPNVSGSTAVVADTAFSVDRGFFDAPFQLRIATMTPGAQVRYTTDGTKPTATTGTPYAGPITIDKTTVVRAAAFAPGMVPSNTDTHTYLFLDDVIRQSHDTALAAGFPAIWGTTTADYGMDEEVIAANATTIENDLKSIPTMSIVLPVADMFGPDGIYTNSLSQGEAWERATSIELIDPTNAPGDTEFQADAGIQIHGGAFRPHGLTKKHSFRLVFKDKWGQPKLDFPLFGPDSADSFDSVVLRADANDSWGGGFHNALYARDLWARRTQRAMGHPASDGNRVHLYINGAYWGLYNPTERPDAAFASAYVGGGKDDWDVRNHNGVVDGDDGAWQEMVRLATAAGTIVSQPERTAAYQKLQGNNPDGTDNPDWPRYLDVDNYIDYLLLNYFIGNRDWPGNNWYAARLRSDTGVANDATGFKFFSWDAETSLDWFLVNTDVILTAGGAVGNLQRNPDFRARFADRVQTHMFGDGALSPANSVARLASVTDEIDRAIVGESARWGDQESEPPFTRETWTLARDRLLNPNYFTNRWSSVLTQLQKAGLFPVINAPAVSVVPGEVPPGTQVQLRADAGTLYYTLDGSDPRLLDGAVNPAATPAATAGTALVPRGSTWKYLDTGVDQGTAWRDPAFDDAAWPAGPAQLGYGDGDEATVVSYGASARSKYTTTYFRKAFTVADPTHYGPLSLRLLRNDGAVVYLNGQEVGRSNFPAFEPRYATRAGYDSEDAEVSFAIDPASLRPGENVLAVELHRAELGGSDLSFDLELVVLAPPVGITLPAGVTRLRARSRDSAGNWSALTDAIYSTDAAASAANVAVTEVHYNPAPPEPVLGEDAANDAGSFEFVELMNTSDRRVALYGARFSYGIKFDFPLDAYLDPGERAVVVKNAAAFRSRYGNGPRILGTYTGNLGNDGQLTILQDGRGRLIDSFRYGDSGGWPGRADGGGASLEVIDPAGDYNDPDNWRPSRAYGGTPGAPSTGAVPTVVINEVLANTDLPQVDRVELFNPTSAAVDVGGWFLSDSNANYRKFRIPLGTVLQPGAHLVFDEAALGFSLDGEGDDVWLLQADPATRRLTRFADRVEFGATPPGESLGRWPSGSPDAALYPMNPTLGTPNIRPRTGQVVINEVHYAPATGGQEFVELFNPGAAVVSLAGWRFTDGIDYTFADGVVIPAGGYLLLVGGDPAAFASANSVPAGVPVLGGFSVEGFLNVLDNAGERLTLRRPGVAPAGQDAPTYEVDRVRFGGAAPWPVLTNGASLARRSTTAWSDAAVNWAAEAAGGSPGRANFNGAAPAPFVAGRHAFHNNSAPDGRSAAAGHLDDYALAGRQALLPGQRAGFVNVTGYSRGINGVMLDVAGLPEGVTLTASDFDLRVGNGSTWASAPAPTSVTVRRGAGTGGSDRVTLAFADNVIRNTWLRVTAKPGARTGLAAPDTFYFGNLAGETGDGANGLTVTAIDVARTRQNLFTRNPAAIARYDFNADGVVNAADLLIARANQGRALATFTAPAAPAVAAIASAREAAIVPARTAAARRRAWDGATNDLPA